MPDYNAPNSLPSDFVQAAHPGATRATATVQLDADVLKWFQEQTPDWQAEVRHALRSFMEDIRAIDRAAPQEPEADYDAGRSAGQQPHGF